MLIIHTGLNDKQGTAEEKSTYSAIYHDIDIVMGTSQNLKEDTVLKIYIGTARNILAYVHLALLENLKRRILSKCLMILMKHF